MYTKHCIPLWIVELYFFLFEELTTALDWETEGYIIMDPGYGQPRSVDAVDPTSSYDAWPTLPSTREARRSRCPLWCRCRLTWSGVSILEIFLMLLTVAFYFFFSKKYLEQILPVDTGKDDQITELSEWVMRMFGSMVSVQVSDFKIFTCYKRCKNTALILGKQREGAKWLLRYLLLYI